MKPGKIVLGRAALGAVLLLAFIFGFPPARQAIGFVRIAKPLLARAAASTGVVATAGSCANGRPVALPDLEPGRRVAVAWLMTEAGCGQLAQPLFPGWSPAAPRHGLLAYQLGMLAFEQGDRSGALRLWRQAQDVDVSFRLRARAAADQDQVEEAQTWYELAIAAASSRGSFAYSLAEYTEFARSLPASRLADSLDIIGLQWPEASGEQMRLRAQRLLIQGNYQAAYEAFEQASELGVRDAETWYLMGSVAERQGDITGAENEYRMALAADEQLRFRRPWHLRCLGALLLQEGRVSEAIEYLEQAVRAPEGGYFEYADLLATAYETQGDAVKAQQACALATDLARAAHRQARCAQ